MKNKRLLHACFCTCLILLLGISAWAQQIISGTLRNASGEPLVAASVSVKGTNRTVMTDASGRFRIEAPAGSTLVITSVGYDPKEIAVTGAEINEVLQTATNSLTDVVVIGYQTVRRRDLTGAVALINPAQANRNVSSTVAESIQGLAPGVTVRNTGSPGSGAKIDIRGAGTFASNNPLYIIDGMYSDATPDFNPHDIESIQILKDASAAAIYGSRAANGVIIITTKRGKEGPMVIGGNIKTGIQQFHKRWEMMDNNEYRALATQLFQAGNVPVPTILTTDFNPNINTDWQEEFMRTGSIQDYNISLSGGTRTANYYISGNYFKNRGPVIDNQFERAGLRINTSGQRGRFKFTENMLISYVHQDPIASDIFTNPFVDMITMLPVIPLRDVQRYGTPTNPEGWGLGLNNAYVNTLAANVPALQSLQQNDHYFLKIRGNITAEVRIMNWLNYKFNLGAETSFDRFRGFRRPGTIRQGTPSPIATADENRANFRSFLFEHTLNFDHQFGEHKISAVAGISNQTNTNEILSGQKSGFVPDANGNYILINLNQGQNPVVNSFIFKNNLVGYLGRLNYTFMDRYLASLTFRRDGSSLFGPDYKWGNFPSASVAWRLSREPFFNVDWVSDLKVRASYGSLGNSEFLRPWQYFGTINPFPRAVFGPAEVEQLGAINTQLANADLRWETKKTLNFGVDAVLLNNLLVLTAEYFISKTEDVLIDLPISLTTGNAGGNPPVNAASLRNKGFELSANYRHPAAGDFKWDVTLNFTTINNEVTSFGDTTTKYTQLGDARTELGRSIGEWYVLRTDGIFQNQAEIDKHGVQPWARPGDIRYVDSDGDGVLNTDKDRVYVGSPWADFELGLIFNASYKNFTFGMQWYGVFGNQLYNRPRYQVDRMDQNTNFREGASPWTPQNTNTDFPRAAMGAPDQGIQFNVLPQTDRWLESGTYMRLRNLEIGYTLSKRILQPIGFTSARIVLSGQNLLTFTKYSGLDPDIAGVNIFERGLDNGQYPALRIISVGVNFGF
ncbi:MAG TPA: TonB-dependent receptor [Chitinophagaceae bacterium]|nr:TonB-dependent receptor [Chitinophagaceae bacterium]